jgi:hypothetical protein
MEEGRSGKKTGCIKCKLALHSKPPSTVFPKRGTQFTKKETNKDF